MRKTLVAVCLAASCALPAFAQTPMEPGNWEIRTTSTTNGKPEPVQEQEECLRDELKDLSAYFSPKLEGVRAQCETTPRQTRDKSIAYNMKCTGATFTMDVESAVRVEDPKRFTATLKLDTKTKTERAIVVANIEGRRTGPCKGK
jgi:hypothetical protein